MAGTPKYAFTLDETGTALIKKDANILLVYMATMVKTQLEDTATLKDAKQLKIKAIKQLIAYAQIPTNNIKISGELKKIIELNNKGCYFIEYISKACNKVKHHHTKYYNSCSSHYFVIRTQR